MGVGMTACLYSEGSQVVCKEVQVDSPNDPETFAVLGSQKPSKEHWNIPVLDDVAGATQAESLGQEVVTPPGPGRGLTPREVTTPSSARAGATLDQSELAELTARLTNSSRGNVTLAKAFAAGCLPRPCMGDGLQRCCNPSRHSIEPSAIVFLDVDGVLHGVGAPMVELFGCEQLAELTRIIRATDAQIVLSTAWRLTDSATHRVINELFNAGLPMPISATPNLRPGLVKGRAYEINAWLQSHAGLVDGGRWLAIDDIPLSPDLPANNVVTTDCQLGLTESIADEAIEKLLRLQGTTNV